MEGASHPPRRHCVVEWPGQNSTNCPKNSPVEFASLPTPRNDLDARRYLAMLWIGQASDFFTLKRACSYTSPGQTEFTQARVDGPVLRKAQLRGALFKSRFQGHRFKV